MSDFTFLTQEQFFGDDKLEIFKRRGTKSAITDFSILLGAYISKSEHVDGDNSLEGRTGWYWTKSDYNDDAARVVDDDGNRRCDYVFKRDSGARPALPFSSISSIPTNGESGKRAIDDILEVEYGYYPQKAPPIDIQEMLEEAFINGSISKTGNSYTTNSVDSHDLDTKFLPQTHQEYEYNGKRYVRVEANSHYDRDFTLSNGKQYRNGDNIWVEVLPVKWLVDERTRTMITEKLIFSGVQFNKEINYHTRDFDRTDIKIFMDRYLARDLVQSRPKDINANAIIDKLKKKIKGQDKALEDVVYALVSNQYIINSGIEDAIQFKTNILIDGPSGTGKTYIIESVAKELGLPCVVTGINNYSATGYQGAELSDILKRLLRASDGNLEKAQKGIVALDEIDKLGRDKSQTDHHLSMKQAVQDELLTYMSGTVIDVEYNGQISPFDTSNLSFIGMGAFVEMHKQKVTEQEERIKRADGKPREYYVSKDDYSDQGLRRELVGRFQTLTHTNELGIEQLKDILINSENSRLKKLTHLAKLKNKKITLTDEAIAYIVEDAFRNNTGARALGDAIENIMGIINKKLFDESVTEINIDEEVVKKALNAQRIQYIDPNSRKDGANR